MNKTIISWKLLSSISMEEDTQCIRVDLLKASPANGPTNLESLSSQSIIERLPKSPIPRQLTTASKFIGSSSIIYQPS